MKKLHILTGSLIALFAMMAGAQTAVEVKLVAALDEARGWCIDLRGGANAGEPIGGLHGHTCYTYNGNGPTNDQAFILENIESDNEFRMVAFNDLCMTLWEPRDGSFISIETCDDRAQQKFLRTYPKRGFQFVAETDCLESGEDIDAPAMASHAPTRRRARVWAGAAVLIIVLVFGGTVWWLTEREVFQAPRPVPAKPSIAVLPFDNLSGDPDQDYFADAFTEDLITDLSRIRDACARYPASRSRTRRTGPSTRRRSRWRSTRRTPRDIG